MCLFKDRPNVPTLRSLPVHYKYLKDLARYRRDNYDISVIIIPSPWLFHDWVQWTCNQTQVIYYLYTLTSNPCFDLWCHHPTIISLIHLDSAAWDCVLVCPAHDALKAYDWLTDCSTFRPVGCRSFTYSLLSFMGFQICDRTSLKRKGKYIYTLAHHCVLCRYI